jgi:hypothetical protein
MKFENEQHEKALEKITEFCDVKQGFQPAAEDMPGFVIRNENALVMILAIPWGEDRTVIQIRGLMVRDVPYSGKAAQWLLKLNDELVLGAFGWSTESGLFFEHTILANDMTQAEFTSSLVAVATTSAAYGPKIIDKFGGKPFFEE